MPHSFKIDFESQDDLFESDLIGRYIHALVFNIIKTVDASLSTEIHDRINKCITIRKIFHRKNQLSIRLTLLDEELFNKFAKALIFSTIPEFTIHDKRLRIIMVKGVKSEESFWSDFISYDDLWNKADRTNSVFNFKIVTPLFFKMGDRYDPLPQPELFFKSLYRKWNDFSPHKIEESFLTQLEKISISYCDIKTEIFKDKMDINFIGSVGKVSFKPKNWDEDFIHKLNVLSNFAYFSGVGAKTTMGMGQVFRY